MRWGEPRRKPRRPRTPQPWEVHCEVDGSCERPAHVFFEGSTLFGEDVTLYVCREHDGPWTAKHPEMTRHEIPPPP